MNRDIKRKDITKTRPKPSQASPVGSLSVSGAHGGNMLSPKGWGSPVPLTLPIAVLMAS